MCCFAACHLNTPLLLLETEMVSLLFLLFKTRHPEESEKQLKESLSTLLVGDYLRGRGCNWLKSNLEAAPCLAPPRPCVPAISSLQTPLFVQPSCQPHQGGSLQWNQSFSKQTHKSFFLLGQLIAKQKHPECQV